MREASTVSQVNRYIKNMFMQEYPLSRISVKGEVSNCTYHSSGHIYFTIKDSASQLSCVMFASKRGGLSFDMKEGDSVIVAGSINVYERDGRYQLYAVQIERDGAGRLYEEYEQLKKRLREEGLFDDKRKKPIPGFARKIGVITSRTGAVIQDICNVSARRNLFVQIVLFPARVQGEGAAEEIVEGLRYFEKSDVDTVIVGRGGGSIEDLWVFNEEQLAREIAACKKPIISAVGHETDTTIVDFVADLRAPTPSAAAELAVFDYREFEGALRTAAYSLHVQMRNKIHMCRMTVERYEAVLRQNSPTDQIRQRRMQTAELASRLQTLMQNRLTAAKHQLALYIEEMKGLSPLYKLQGGYAYVENVEGGHITSVEQVEPEDRLLLHLADGQLEAVVAGVTKKTGGEDGSEEIDIRRSI